MKTLVKWNDIYFATPRQFFDFMQEHGIDVDIYKVRSAFYHKLQSVERTFNIEFVEVSNKFYRKAKRSKTGIHDPSNIYYLYEFILREVQRMRTDVGVKWNKDNQRVLIYNEKELKKILFEFNPSRINELYDKIQLISTENNLGLFLCFVDDLKEIR